VTPSQLLTALGGAIGGVARGCLQNWIPDISQHGPYKHILGYPPFARDSPRPLPWRFASSVMVMFLASMAPLSAKVLDSRIQMP